MKRTQMQIRKRCWLVGKSMLLSLGYALMAAQAFGHPGHGVTAHPSDSVLHYLTEPDHLTAVLGGGVLLGIALFAVLTLTARFFPSRAK